MAKITVTSAGTKATVTATPDTSMYYSNRSREWAISDKIVDNEDYSSKYYANESKKQAQISTEKTEEVVNSSNIAISNISTVENSAITNILNQEVLSIENVNNTGISQINNIKTEGAKQVTLATDKANIATTQAGIATAKTTEVVQSGNTALSNIATAKSNALNEINTTGAGYVENAEQYAQNALNSANNAALSESNALSYKNSIQESSQIATEQANIAVTNANKAKISETNAKSSETRCEEILSRLGAAIKIKGRVDSIGDLPLSGNLDGDAYLVGEEGLGSYPEYYWYQDHWEFLGTSGGGSGSGGGGTWGSITGNITAQRDLIDKFNTKQDVLIAGTGIDITNNVISNTQTSAEWGNIQGTLANQTDLQTALNNKQDVISDLATIRAGASKGATAVQSIPSEYVTETELNAKGYLTSYTETDPIYTADKPNIAKTNLSNLTEEGKSNLKQLIQEEFNNPYSLFDSKYSPIELNNISWLKSNGQWNAKAVYPAAYNELLKEYNNSNKSDIFNQNAFEVVGSPTITNDGIASGFSGSNYLKTPSINFSTASNWLVEFEFTTPSSSSSLNYNRNIFGREKYLRVALKTNLTITLLMMGANIAWADHPSSKTLSLNTKYYGKAYFTGSSYKLDLSEDGINYSNYITYDNSNKIYSTYLNIGYSESGGDNYSWAGSIDLKQFSVTVNGQKIFSGTILSSVNSIVKLSTEDYTDYDFVLNTADETFRLPLLDGSEDLPSDRYDNLELLASGNPYTAPANGYFELGKSSTASGQYLSLFVSATQLQQALVSSASGQNIASFLPVKKGTEVTINYSLGGTTNRFRFIYAQGNGSLYYYVGETVQNANLIDAGRIGEQLANKIGRTECKAYITETYVNGTSWYRVYSDGWCEQGGATANKVDSPITVTLLKAYINNLYSVQITINGTASSPNSNTFPYQALGKTASSFIVANYNSGSGANNYYQWEACGYIR